MLGIDTNVLVRYLVEDDRKQSAAACRIFKKISESNPAFINNVVVCELVWVLSRAYGYKKAVIVETLEHLFSVSAIEFENIDILRNALKDYIEGKMDFADCLIAQINSFRKVETTFTFDKKAKANSLFTVVK